MTFRFRIVYACCVVFAFGIFSGAVDMSLPQLLVSMLALVMIGVPFIVGDDE